MEKANKVLREELKAKGIPYWQLAVVIGVNETTIVRWMRTPLSEDKVARIRAAIVDITENKED